MRTKLKFLAVILASVISLCACSTAQARTVECKSECEMTADTKTSTIYNGVEIYRFGGNNRFTTSQIISANFAENNPENVFLADAYTYADALVGAPLAFLYDAPIILVDGKTSDVGSALNSVSDDSKNIYLLGGPAAISRDIEEYLIGKGHNVRRIWGATRYETGIEIAKEIEKLKGGFSEAFIASGANFPDALSASSVAAIKTCPILYSPANGKLDNGTSEYLRNTGVEKAYVLGGTAAIGDGITGSLSGAGVKTVERIGGSDRYDTSLKIAERFNSVFSADCVSFATGKSFPDALSGSVFAAKMSSPVLLTDNSHIYNGMKKYISGKELRRVYIFGSDSAVSDKTVQRFIDKVEENYRWTVEPTIQADDISPLHYYCFTDDSLMDYDTNYYSEYGTVKRNGKYGIVDYSGAILTDVIYDTISIGNNDEFYLYDKRKDGTDEYYTFGSDGRISSIPNDSAIYICAPLIEEWNYAWVEDMGLYFDEYGFIDKFDEKNTDTYPQDRFVPAVYLKKERLKKAEYYEYEYKESDGVIPICDGKPVGNVIYEAAMSTSYEGLLAVKKNGKWGYINDKGNVVIPFEHDACWNVHYNDGQYEENYTRPFDASGGYVAVCRDGQYALYDTIGNIVIDYGTFERVRPVYEGKCWVRQNGLWGVIELQ